MTHGNTSVVPARERCEEAVLAALKALGGAATRRDITAVAMKLGNFSRAERQAEAPPSKPQYASYLEYCISWSFTTLRQCGAVENPDRGYWTLSAPDA